MSVPDEGFSRNMRTKFDIYVFHLNKGNNKITEHRAILAETTVYRVAFTSVQTEKETKTNDYKVRKCIFSTKSNQNA
jgi:hypothetical protein